DVPRNGIMEAAKEIDDCRLAAARDALKNRDVAGRNVEAHVMDDGQVAVGKADMLEMAAAIDGGLDSASVPFGVGSCFVHQVEHTPIGTFDLDRALQRLLGFVG